MECFCYNYTIINCLLTIFVYNYYAKSIYVNKCCQSLTDWSISVSTSFIPHAHAHAHTHRQGKLIIILPEINLKYDDQSKRRISCFSYDDAVLNEMVSSTFNILDRYVIVKHRFSRVVEQRGYQFKTGLFGHFVM